MARQLLQHCKKCQVWTLQRECPQCNETINAAAPLKWSPEDQRANIRRKMYNVESEVVSFFTGITRYRINQKNPQ